MEPARGHATQGEKDSPDGEFFIPDLCASRSVFVMVLLAELMVIVHVLANSELPRYNWEMLATNSLIVQWVVLLSAALLCPLRKLLSRVSLPLASLCSLLVVTVVTIASSYLAQLFLPILGSGNGATSWWLLRNTLVAVVLAGVVLRYFYLQHQLRRQEKLELLARLESLRARIRPHFLFNTLNSIASLIMSRPDAAEQAVEDLSELFRVSLQESYRDTTVADELRLCELYLGIEQLRLGERLQVEWQLAEGVVEKPMPSLILQPLVENAVYHGISQLPAGGTVRIALGFQGDAVQASVENPIPPGAARSDGNQLALANIRQRLEALYGPGGVIRAAPEGDVYRVCLSYPPETVA